MTSQIQFKTRLIPSQFQFGLLNYLLFGSEHYLARIVAKEKSEDRLDTQKWMETLQQLAGENFLEIMIRMAKGQLTLYSTKLQIKEPCLRSGPLPPTQGRRSWEWSAQHCTYSQACCRHQIGKNNVILIQRICLINLQAFYP